MRRVLEDGEKVLVMLLGLNMTGSVGGALGIYFGGVEGGKRTAAETRGKKRKTPIRVGEHITFSRLISLIKTEVDQVRGGCESKDPTLRIYGCTSLSSAISQTRVIRSNARDWAEERREELIAAANDPERRQLCLCMFCTIRTGSFTVPRLHKAAEVNLNGPLFAHTSISSKNIMTQ